MLHAIRHVGTATAGTYVGVRDMEKCKGQYAPYGVVKDPGHYCTTLTRPDVMYNYYLDQVRMVALLHMCVCRCVCV